MGEINTRMELYNNDEPWLPGTMLQQIKTTVFVGVLPLNEEINCTEPSPFKKYSLA